MGLPFAEEEVIRLGFRKVITSKESNYVKDDLIFYSDSILLRWDGNSQKGIEIKSLEQLKQIIESQSSNQK